MFSDASRRIEVNYFTFCSQSGLKMIVNVQCFSYLALVAMFGYLFLSNLGPQLNISTLSTLVFLILQKFVFTLHVRYCCVIRAYSSDFNPSSYLQLWIGSLHQSYTAGASLGRWADRAFLFRCWWLHTTWYCTSAKTFAVVQIWWP